MAKYKLDIFKLLDAAKKGDWQYFKNLPKEQQKELVPYVAVRWLASSNSRRQLLRVCEVLPVLEKLLKYGTHDNVYQLMVSITDDRPVRYKWLKAENKKTGKRVDSFVAQTIANYFSISRRTALETAKNLSKDEVIEMGTSMAYDEKLMKTLEQGVKNWN